MNVETCPKFEKCPIFTGVAFQRTNSSEVYKTLYCNAGEVKYKTCKRYIASEKLGRPIPQTIMPNSDKTVEEIEDMINKSV